MIVLFHLEEVLLEMLQVLQRAFTKEALNLLTFQLHYYPKLTLRLEVKQE